MEPCGLYRRFEAVVGHLRRALGVWIALALLILEATTVAATASYPPEVVYHNGRVLTLDARGSIVEAVAVRDGRIIAVGTDTEVLGLAADHTPLVDLGGLTTLPGFYDNHIHIGGQVQAWQGGLVPAVAEWTRGTGTLDRLLEALRRRVAEVPVGEWIQGGLTRPDWPNDKVPSRWQLDEVAPHHPVVLTRGPHTLILNSLALRLAGITEATPDPEGGWIIRDRQGVPSGRILESARRLVTPLLPASPAVDEKTALARLRRQLQQLLELGITSVNIAGVRPEGIRRVQELYELWGEELPRATLQIRLRRGYDTYDDPEEGIRRSLRELEALGFRTGFGNERLKLGAIKMSIDGGLSAPVFWSTAPYEGRPGFHGAVRIPASTFYPVAKRAHDLGWQLGIHTMGDAAVDMVVEQLERILERAPRADHRHYLHHVAVLPSPRTLQRIASLGILVASQPSFTVGLGAFAVEALEAEREQTQNPTRTLLDHGIRMSYGSDSAPYGPMIGIWSAVTRRGWQGKVYGAGEAVSVEQALRLYTLGSAYMTFDERVKGTLELGKLADMVVLGEDPMTVDPERIRNIRIAKTIIGGRQVFDSTESSSVS